MRYLTDPPPLTARKNPPTQLLPNPPPSPRTRGSVILVPSIGRRPRGVSLFWLQASPPPPSTRTVFLPPWAWFPTFRGHPPFLHGLWAVVLYAFCPGFFPPPPRLGVLAGPSREAPSSPGCPDPRALPESSSITPFHSRCKPFPLVNFFYLDEELQVFFSQKNGSNHDLTTPTSPTFPSVLKEAFGFFCHRTHCAEFFSFPPLCWG